jgi:hypothetical protein
MKCAFSTVDNNVSNFCSFSLLLSTGWFRRKSIFCEAIISVIVRKKVHINMYLILNCYRDNAVWIWWFHSLATTISRLNSFRSFFVGLDEKRSLQKKLACTRRIDHTNSGYCWISQTNNTRSWHTCCKVQWGWPRNFRTCIVNCKEYVISV